MSDADYGSDVYGLAFAPDGTLIASSWDGQLRRYGQDLKLAAKRAAPDGKKPYGLAIDPKGQRVAVGYEDQTPLSILDAKTLQPVAKAQTSDVNGGDFKGVAWSRGGATLIGGGAAAMQSAKVPAPHLLRRFDADGRRQGADIASASNTVMAIQPCGDGFAFAAADPTFGLVSAQGVPTTLQGPRTADMRSKRGSALSVSRDASSVRFGLGYSEDQPVVFDLAAAALSDSLVFLQDSSRRELTASPSRIGRITTPQSSMARNSRSALRNIPRPRDPAGWLQLRARDRLVSACL